jgi:hypothetical protein
MTIYRNIITVIKVETFAIKYHSCRIIRRLYCTIFIIIRIQPAYLSEMIMTWVYRVCNSLKYDGIWFLFSYRNTKIFIIPYIVRLIIILNIIFMMWCFESKCIKEIFIVLCINICDYSRPVSAIITYTPFWFRITLYPSSPSTNHTCSVYKSRSVINRIIINQHKRQIDFFHHISIPDNMIRTWFIFEL